MTDDTFAIQIENLGVRYDGRSVLSGFSLQMKRGEKVTLTGPSGAGKSTVLRCLLGLVVPQQGAIRIYGRALDGQSVWDLRQQIAYVAQEPDLGRGTAREVIGRLFDYRANARLRPNLDRLPQWMERFNLSQGLLDKDMSDLSGGEKQRVALVCALLLDRSIVLLDEASSALDQANKQAVADYFREAGNLTVLSVAHDKEWRTFAHRVIELAAANPGRAVAESGGGPA